MVNVAVGGLQAGDEAKGKVLDTIIGMLKAEMKALGEYVRMNAVRFQGGNNAGHTLIVSKSDCPTAREDMNKLALHQVPSAVVYSDVDLFQARGMVEDFEQLQLENMAINHQLGVEIEDRLYVDSRLTMNLVYHRVLDFAMMIADQRRAGLPFEMSTTGRGIGPAYVSELSRDPLHPLLFLDTKDRFRGELEIKAERAAAMIQKVYEISPDDFMEIMKTISEKEEKAQRVLLDAGLINPERLDYTRFIDRGAFSEGRVAFDLDRILEETWAIGQHYKDRIINVSREIRSRMKSDEIILFEAAQGPVLDYRWGVKKSTGSTTCSHPLFSEIPLSTGVHLDEITERIVVAKAYGTKVGDHYFVTEMQPGEATVTLDGETRDLVDYLKENEFGATTGRQRMVGWFDLPESREYAILGNPTGFAIAKLDLFSGANIVKVCTHYVDTETGEKYYRLPDDPNIVGRCRPEYREFEGWQEDISQCTTMEELPQQAQDFLYFIRDELKKEVPQLELKYVSGTPNRGVIKVEDAA